MKKVFLYIALVIFISAAAGIQAQTLTKDAVLQNPSGNRITLGTPASVTNNKILLPGTLGLQGAILYISSVASTTGTTTWLNPGSNGDVLTLSGGVPTWSASPALNFWGFTGNGHTVTDNTNNLLGTTTSAPLRLITGGAANTRVLISATGDVLVNGTAGTPNVRTTSLTSASAGSTGGVMFADASGYLNRLAVPASNGQILTSTTAGVLSWTSSPTLTYWDLTGNGHTVTDNTNNLLGTTTAAPLRIITGGAANTRIHIASTGEVGIGAAATSGRLLQVTGTAGTANVRLTSLSSTNLSTALAANDGLVIADANGDLTKRATSILDGSFVKYDVGSTQSNSLTRTNNLFNVSYGGLAADANAAGAVITSAGGATNRTATGLTVTATGTGTGTSTGLSISSSTGTGTATGLSVTATGTSGSRNAIDATGNVRLLSAGGTASNLTFQNPAATFSSTFVAGAQGANFNYTLPTTIPTAGQILTASAVAAPAVTLSWTSPGASTAWGLTGNASTTAGTNFIGTTDSVDWVIKTNSGGTGGERVRVDAEGQVGVGNIQPKVMMDIKGGLATRSGTLALSNGTNNNVYIGDTSYVRISGLTAAGKITGIRNGYDGKFLTVFNTTDQTLTFAHNSSSSIDTTRIINVIGQGGDVTIEDSGTVDLRYDGTMQRWIITNVRGGMSAVANGNAYFARCTVDTTNSNNASLRVAEELNLPLKPNIIHTLDGMLYFKNTTSGNPAYKIGFSPTVTVTLMKITALGHDDGGTNTVKGSDILDVSGGASADFDLNSGTEQFVHISGIIINGSTSGTLKFSFRPSANGDPITLKAGSYIRLIPVGVN